MARPPLSGFHDRHNSRIRASDFPQAASSRYLGPVVRGPHSPRTASRGSEVRGSGRVAAHPESISTVCVHASDYGGHSPTSANRPCHPALGGDRPKARFWPLYGQVDCSMMCRASCVVGPRFLAIAEFNAPYLVFRSLPMSVCRCSQSTSPWPGLRACLLQ